MIEAAAVLPRPEVAQAFRILLREAMIAGGISAVHADKVAAATAERLEKGENVTAATDIFNVLQLQIRAAVMNEAADVVDRARGWAEGDLRGVRDHLRAMAKDPSIVDGEDEDEDDEA